jgi:hypothetical protein
MLFDNARTARHWIRQNLFDGWQMLGAVGLLVGALGLGLLLMMAEHHLPDSGGTFKLVQTVVSDLPFVHPSDEPTVAPSASPVAASPKPGPGAAIVPVPSATRSAVRHGGTPSRPGSPAATASPTDSSTASASPTPRPGLPHPSVSPTPTPRPSIH